MERDGTVVISVKEIDCGHSFPLPTATHTWRFPKWVIAGFMLANPMMAYNLPYLMRRFAEMAENKQATLTANRKTPIIRQDNLTETIIDAKGHESGETMTFEKEADDDSMAQFDHEVMDEIAWSRALMFAYMRAGYDSPFDMELLNGRGVSVTPKSVTA